MQMDDFIFVYGTLRQGQSNDISDWTVSGTNEPAVEFIGFDAIDGVMYDCGWYPGVQQPDDFGASGEGKEIFGEVFKIVAPGVADRLDMYEGYPSLYDRVQVTTMTGLKVWVYTYQDPMDDIHLVDGGDWVKYIEEKKRRERLAVNDNAARIDCC